MQLPDPEMSVDPWHTEEHVNQTPPSRVSFDACFGVLHVSNQEMSEVLRKDVSSNTSWASSSVHPYEDHLCVTSFLSPEVTIVTFPARHSTEDDLELKEMTINYDGERIYAGSSAHFLFSSEVDNGGAPPAHDSAQRSTAS
ncbi:uncharacterized protein PHACADRAFT_246011 [Phanerochaete carnosa HHB-10118-sp]|uniref:Uncharacterized protein n=1 Tax=Phanerochaete carnosa (strain HHB-10118-sp) TaxID=650164 RepID=K5VB95_PHACS|nr:uncharacterized protein PHACADRAFT_246011 [Phanerochaete carnosa HHB-10118-sp]EKM60171.1 hypothetical protein PHACADRAFT_246011 [Phanerochaete carnosa HHB-10118-sp]